MAESEEKNNNVESTDLNSNIESSQENAPESVEQDGVIIDYNLPKTEREDAVVVDSDIVIDGENGAEAVKDIFVEQVIVKISRIFNLLTMKQSTFATEILKAIRKIGLKILL